MDGWAAGHVAIDPLRNKWQQGRYGAGNEREHRAQGIKGFAFVLIVDLAPKPAAAAPDVPVIQSIMNGGSDA
jgi:hypothetical protein